MQTLPLAPVARWRDLFAGTHAWRVAVLAGGIALHAINLYLTTSILPTVVGDIGGMPLYAWNTTVFVVASIVGAAMAVHLLQRTGPPRGYGLACAVFAAGSAVCALAPAMPVLLLGRLLQGLGGGVLLAMPYVLIRHGLPAALWPRALALFSGMWGVATLLGPAVGGALAQYAHWRLAFGALVPATLLLAAGAALALRRVAADVAAAAPPLRQLTLLVLAVLAASCSTLPGNALAGGLGLAGAALLLLAIRHRERRAGARLLPRAAYASAGLLGPLYTVSALMAITVTCTELFIPLFLQRIQGHTPLGAGYIAATASAGWTLGALCSATLAPTRADRLGRAAPWPCAVALAVLCVAMPQPSATPQALATWSIVLSLTLLGFGVGLAWPQLASSVMAAAPAEEADLASGALMTVQLIATTLSAAVGGYLIAITAGDRQAELGSAAAWLFGGLVLAPLAALLLWPPRPRRQEDAT